MTGARYWGAKFTPAREPCATCCCSVASNVRECSRPGHCTSVWQSHHPEASWGGLCTTLRQDSLPCMFTIIMALSPGQSLLWLFPCPSHMIKTTD